jgi:hypothetical protein
MSICGSSCSPSCGLYYKHVMIINYASSSINKLRASLNDDARVVIYNRHIFIVQATGHGVLAEADDNNTLIVGHPLEIYGPPAQTSPNTLINYYNNNYI